MPSMEELNEFEHARNSSWGIDKKIPIALIFVVVLQTLGFTWGAATLSSEVKNNSKIIEKLEVKIEAIVQKDHQLIQKFQRKDASIREHGDMKHQVENLEDRVREIERTRFTKDMWKNYNK